MVATKKKKKNFSCRTNGGNKYISLSPSIEGNKEMYLWNVVVLSALIRADKTTCQIFLSSLTGRQKLFCWLRCQFCSSSPVFWLRCIHGHVGVSSSHWFRIWDDSNNGAFFTSISFNKFVMNLFTKFGLKVWKIRWLLRLCPKPHWWSPELSQNALKTWYSSKWR